VSPLAKKQKESKSSSPLTLPARWFSETKQYLFAFLASIAVFGLLADQIAKIAWNNWVVYVVASIPALLVFLCRTLPRLINEHRYKILAESSKRETANHRTTVTAADYFSVAPYSESRRQRYDRADGVHKEVLTWLKGTQESVVILSGLSGTGKTSLLQAFVIPELRKSRPSVTVLLIRGLDDPLAELRRQLLNPGVIWTKPDADLAGLALTEIVKRAVSRLRQDDPAARLVAVLDQFEEIVTLGETSNSTPSKSIADLLRAHQKSPIDGFLLLLAIRTDYLMFLELLGVAPLDQRRNWRQVPAFTHSAALSFLTAPETGLNIHEKRLHRVLREAVAADGTRGLIRPVILNTIGLVLRRLGDSVETEQPTRELFTKDCRALIDRPDRRVVNRAILPHMLTEADTKRPRSVAELSSATKLDAQIINGCLLQLGISGYVRQISGSPEIVNRVWEVSHDFVAHLLGPILRHPCPNFWERFRRLFYPLSVGAWVIAAGSLAFVGPWLDRKAAESQLKKTYNFLIQKTANGYVLTENDPDFNQLPAAATYLSKLAPIVLDLSGCTRLTSVNGLKELTNLQQLDLSNCFSLTNVDGLKKLKNLQRLNLSYCTSLTSIDALEELTNLQQLDLTRCTSLTSIDRLEKLKHLQQLSLNDCFSLTNVDRLQDLKNLQQLDLTDCFSLTNVDGLQELKNLRQLDLTGCTSLTNINGLRELENLQQLDLTGCGRLTNIDGLKGLKNLEQLNLNRCTNLTNIDGLKELANLQQLELTSCTSLKSVDALKDLKNFQRLSFSGCSSLTSIDGLDELENLQQLDLSGCSSLTNIDGLNELKNLRQLNLSGCSSLINMEGLEELKNLQRLDLSGCTSLTSVDDLKELNNLRQLDLIGCTSLANVYGLEELKNLQQLDLTRCSSLASLDGLKELKNLQELNLTSCSSLTNTDGLKELKSLRQLNLTGCTSLMSIDGLKELKDLKQLDLSGCTSLTNIDGLKDLANLQQLDLSGCTSLTSVDLLKELKNLQELFLADCTQLSADAIAELHKRLTQTNIAEP
jgi:Leucine-rich repeat (LRR) protein